MKKVYLTNNTVVEIPEGPIGISCSGGADSSLLLYILMSNVVDPIHVFTLSDNTKGRPNAVVMARVIEKCIQLTGNLNIIHHSYYSDTMSESNLFDFQRDYLRNRTIGCIFFGITANPPETVKFSNPSTEHDHRDPTVIKNEIDQGGFLRRPFVNKDKKTIAQIYKDLDLMETLFPVTRSCEATGQLEYYNHCGKCWWCEERLWGFNRV